MSESGEEQPHRKKLKLSASLCWLPDELALNCLARISRSDHRSLSAVSKWYRSKVMPPDLYDFRSLTGFTENCIYLCLVIPPLPKPRWFTFFPNRSPRRLIPVRSQFHQPREVSSVVALGCGIYVIGGSSGGRRSSRVSFFDCRSHTWTTLPSMGVARASAAVGVVRGKIYVLGGCEDRGSPRWGEVFDPKRQTWKPLPRPPKHHSLRRFPFMFESGFVVEDKVFALNGQGRGFFYVPSEGIWKIGNMDKSGIRRGWYVIGNVIYCCAPGGRILWCEPGELERNPEVMEWREVMGLGALRDTLCASKLVNYGGWMWDHWESVKRHVVRDQLSTKVLDDILPGHKLGHSGSNMLLFWDVLCPHSLEIWCAEISLQRCKETGKVWGTIEWSEAVMTLDPPTPPSPHHNGCKLLYNLSITL